MIFVNLGDRNMKYFHEKTISRVKRSQIEMLRIGDNWCSDGEVLRREAVHYFRKLYQEDNTNG